jgi:hypothetical protein
MNAIEAAKNQSFFREVNERMRGLSESVEQVSGGADFLCECAEENCTDPIQITLDDYEEMRRVPTHFAVAAGMDHVSRTSNGSLRSVTDTSSSRSSVRRVSPRSSSTPARVRGRVELPCQLRLDTMAANTRATGL